MIRELQTIGWGLGVLSCLFVAAGCDTGQAGAENRAESTEQRAPEQAWRIWRGSADLRGRTAESLPHPLVLRWKRKIGDQVLSTAAIVDRAVFIGSDGGKVFRLSAEDGSVDWTFDTGEPIEAGALVQNGVVYIGSADGALYAIDAKQGRKRWKYPTEHKIAGAANWVEPKGKANPRLLVGSYDGKLYCVDAITGRGVWAFATDNYVNGTAAVDDDRVVFGGCDAKLRILNLQNGQKLHAVDLGSYIPGTVALAGGKAFAATYKGALACVDASTGKVEWTYQPGEQPFFSSPAVGEALVVIGDKTGTVHAVKRSDGSKAWTFQARDAVDSSPVIAGDDVWFGSDDGRLYRLELATGNLRWSYRIGAPVGGSPAVAGGMVVIGASDGFVYAFKTRPDQAGAETP